MIDFDKGMLIIVDDPTINLTICDHLPRQKLNDGDDENVLDPTAHEQNSFDFIEEDSYETDLAD